MNIEKIDKALEPKVPTETISQIYGVIGLSLGKELHKRLKAYAGRKQVSMAKIIKTLVIAYLDEKEKDNA